MTSINTNISAYYAQNNLRSAGAMSQSSIARLSSGNKIIKASDDVAALSVGTILRTNVNTLKTALTNANQGATLLQVADGALARVGEILQRQKALATQANSGTLSATEKGYLNQEFSKLSEELNRIVERTNFNGVNLIDGTLAADNTTLASERPSATGKFAMKLTDTDSTVSTSVITGGEAGLTVTAVGTSDRALAAFQGSLADINVSSVYSGGTSLGSLTVEINGVRFQTAFNSFDNTNADTTVALTQVLTAEEAADGVTAMALNLSLADLGETGDQAGMDDAAELIQAELRKITVYQDRTLESTEATDASAITAEKFYGSVLQGMDGGSFNIRGIEFETTDDIAYAPSISNFQITSMSSTLAKMSVVINGVTYSTEHTTGLEDGVTVDTDITNNDLDGSASDATDTGVIRLTSASDANSFIEIDFDDGTAGAIDLSSQALADGIAAALNAAFGSGSTGGIDFQVGTASTDKISIGLAAVDTNSLYVDNDGASVTMDLVTGDIDDMQEALDNAIKTVTARRADVGALQSRFNFAASTLEVSIQNLDAARSAFLDADISEESTAFAKAQVLQQAAISVLAQANQIPQNLLKLIG